MKAISVKQPWASLIVHGIKDIENRTWNTNFRGKVFIHASAKDAGALYELLNEKQIEAMNNHWTNSPYPLRPLSAIIGEVEIIDCVINHQSIWAEKTIQNTKNYKGNPFDKPQPIYNWVLANPILYDKPILNVKGKLSFWEPDIDITKCESCSQPCDIEKMTTDSEGCWFCQPCYDELSPIWEKEYEDMVRKGEIEP